MAAMGVLPVHPPSHFTARLTWFGVGMIRDEWVAACYDGLCRSFTTEAEAQVLDPLELLGSTQFAIAFVRVYVGRGFRRLRRGAGLHPHKLRNLPLQLSLSFLVLLFFLLVLPLQLLDCPVFIEIVLVFKP